MAFTEFFEGFSWAVPTAFRSALDKCCLEEGDALYDSREAYNLPWEQAKKALRHSVHVRFPKRVTVSVDSTEERNVFARNWRSEVKLNLLRYPSMTRDKVTTSQGALYTLLWKGVIDVLNASVDSLPPPATLVELDHALEGVSRGQLEKAFPQATHGICFLTAFSHTHDISRSKRSLIEGALHQFGNNAHNGGHAVEFLPQDLGVDSEHVYLPTLRVCVYVVRTEQSAQVAEALKNVLHKPAKSAKKEQFRLRNHGILLPLSS
jgi:hypothetical protein